MAQKIEGKQERPLQTYFLKNFAAVNTVANRMSEPQDACFWDLTNAQPIGFSNLHSINDATAPIYDFTTHRVYADFNVNIGNQEYLLIATRDGLLYAYTVGSSPPVVTQIGSGLSTDGSLDISQFDDTTALIIANSGYYSWQPGGNITNISGTVAGITITAGGTGYTNPTIAFSGGGGTGAAATLHQTGGVIDGFTMTSGGSGYTSTPTATISDPAGHGATVTVQTGAIKGQAITVYQNMAWIADGRTLYASKPGSSSDTSPAYTDFSVSDGGGWEHIRDPSLKSDIKALYALNGLLYVFGESSVDAVGNVQQIQTTAGTAVTGSTASWTRQNISSIVGTDHVESIMAYGRLIFFANQYGIWMLYGTTVQLVSTDVQNSYYSGIDGTWQFLDWNHFTDSVLWINNAGDQVDWQNNAGATVQWMLDNYTPYLFKISGGQVVSNQLLCAVFVVVRKNDPAMGSGNFLVLYQGDATGSSGKWWFADWTSDIGPITHICTAMVNNAPALFGYIENRLYQFFADPTTSPSARMMTALWDFGDPLSDKQALRAGIRVSLRGTSDAAMMLHIDTLTNSYPVPLGDIGTIDWVSDIEALVPWQNNVPQPVKWQNLREYLIYHGKAPECYSKNLGFTLRSQRGTQFELNAFYLDYKIGPRWVGA